MLDEDPKFNEAFDFMLRHEGEYSNNPLDRGGQTKYGISAKQYPKLDIKNLTLEKAKAIYKQDYWDKQLYAQIFNPEVRNKIFDLAVNVGPAKAHKIVQASLIQMHFQITADGVFGNMTLTATNDADPVTLLALIKIEAMKYYTKIATNDTKQRVFLTGWINRVLA